MWKLKKLPLYIDLAFCFLLLPAMLTLLPIERWLVNNSLFVCMLVAWLYIVYILNRRYTMPALFAADKRRWTAIAILLITLAGTYLITCYQMDFPFVRPHRARPIAHVPKLRMQQQAVWFLYVVVTAFSIAVGLLTELYHQIIQKQEMEVAKKKAELALYKAQINPHFLFNSLNTLYGMIITQSPHVEDAFMQFIQLMKYMYANSTKDKIPVCREAEHIRQYIGLQKYRMPDTCHIHFSYEHDTTDQLEIPPLIAVTFIENVFKHGISSHEPEEVFIILRAENGKFLLSTDNPLLNHPAQKASKGIGIENCRKRLELLYPDRFTLKAGIDNGRYKVLLSIELKNEHGMCRD